MPKDGLTKRAWYSWSPRDFRSDGAVFRMTQEQRWRYRDALDESWLSETPGEAREEQWRIWCGYGVDDWAVARAAIGAAFSANDDGIWVQKRLRAEFLHATEKSRKAAEAGASAQRSLSVRSTDAGRPTGARPAPAVRDRDRDRVERRNTGSSSSPSVNKKNAAGAASGLIVQVSELVAAVAALPERRRKMIVSAALKAKAAGESEHFVTFMVSHYVQHHETIENPFAYYAAGSTTRLMFMQWSANREISRHAEERALTEEFLRGKKPR